MLPTATSQDSRNWWGGIALHPQKMLAIKGKIAQLSTLLLLIVPLRFSDLPTALLLHLFNPGIKMQTK